MSRQTPDTLKSLKEPISGNSVEIARVPGLQSQDNFISVLLLLVFFLFKYCFLIFVFFHDFMAMRCAFKFVN